MTVVVTNNVAPKFRGFLTSCMLEVAPGVYLSPKMNAGVRERVWSVCNEWFIDGDGSSIVLAWQDASAASGTGLEVLGTPRKTLTDHEGVILVSRPLNQSQLSESDP